MTAAAATRRALEAAINAAASTTDPYPALLTALAADGATRALVTPAGLALDAGGATGRALFDAALRSALAAALAAAVDAGAPVADYAAPGAAGPTVPALLSLAAAAAAAGGVDVATPLAALEDAVEATPAAQAADAAALIETVGGAALAAAGWDKCKLPLLRVCAGLLARLPRRAARAPAAAARVHFFLAAAAPPSDKSGLNLLGAANEGHPVVVEPVEGGAEGDGDGDAATDPDLYTAFWSLAPALQDPVAHLPPDAWPRFAATVRTVLAAFKATPVAVAAGPAGDAGAHDAAAADALPPVGPFYLASPSLFPLQLRDGTARRVFLVAALAAIHAARHPPPKLADRRGGLRSKALADAAALEADLYSALAATPERGAAFAAAVRATLARETAWAAWKAAAPPCPPLDRLPRAPPGGGAADAPPARPPRGGLGAPPPPTLGTPDLDRLWSVTPDNAVDDLKSADRGVVPSLREFLRPVALEMDPEAGIEKPYKRQASAVYQWKALRRIARADMAAFGASLAAGRDLEVALAALFPDDVPAGWAPPPPPAKDKDKDKEEGGGERVRKRKAADDDGGEEAAAEAGGGEAAAEAAAGDAPAESPPPTAKSEGDDPAPPAADDDDEAVPADVDEGDDAVAEASEEAGDDAAPASEPEPSGAASGGD